MPDVRMPDGTVIRNVPEGTTKQQLLERLGKSLQTAPGMIESGNINIHDRPVVKNADGTISTVRSMSINVDGREVLIPTVSDDGRIMSDEEAIKTFRRTGRHLGMFETPKAATAFAKRLHNQQAAEFGGAQRPASPSPVAPTQQEAPAPVAFTEAALRRFVNNVLGLPQAAVNLSAATARGVGLPAGPTVDLGLPDMDDLAAVGQGLEKATTAFLSGEPVNLPQLIQEERNALADRVAAQRRASPVATMLGQGAGDIATLATGRAGVRAGAKAFNLGQIAPKIETTAKTIVGRALQNFGRGAARTGRRATETGLEGAFLASLQDSDPGEVAAMAAGSQVFGDVSLSAFRKLASGNNLLKAIALGTVASLGIQQLTPGGLDRILPTLEGRNKEAIITMLLGGVGGAALGGRVPKDFAGPAFAELVDVTRRGALISLLSSMARDPLRIAPIVQKFTEDPDYFGPRAKRLLTRALTSENIDIRTTIETLMKDRGFKRKFQALTAPESVEARPERTVPSREELAAVRTSPGAGGALDDPREVRERILRRRENR